jgi:hypothetical protein
LNPDLFAQGDHQMDRSQSNILEFVRQEINLAATFLQVANAELAIREKQASAQSGRDAATACKVARRFLGKLPALARGAREQLENELVRIETGIREFQAL